MPIGFTGIPRLGFRSGEEGGSFDPSTPQLLRFYYTWLFFGDEEDFEAETENTPKQLNTKDLAERGGFEPPLGCLFPKTV